MTDRDQQARGRAGHEHSREVVDKDVTGEPGVGREGSFTDSDVESAEPTSEREGDYTDTDVSGHDTGPSSTTSYVSKDVPG